jgi:alkylhydroperoxidase family enzyme
VYGKELVNAVLRDGPDAPVSVELKAALRLTSIMTLEPDRVAEPVAAMRAIGMSDQKIRDAVDVCFIFNTIDRLADSFSFALPGEESHDKAAQILLKRGYVMPGILAR